MILSAPTWPTFGIPLAASSPHLPDSFGGRASFAPSHCSPCLVSDSVPNASLFGPHLCPTVSCNSRGNSQQQPNSQQLSCEVGLHLLHSSCQGVTTTWGPADDSHTGSVQRLHSRALRHPGSSHAFGLGARTTLNKPLTNPNRLSVSRTTRHSPASWQLALKDQCHLCYKDRVKSLQWHWRRRGMAEASSPRQVAAVCGRGGGARQGAHSSA